MLGPPGEATACDALYVSAYDEDSIVSCPARILSERAQGLRVRIVSVFGAGDVPAEADIAPALARIGVWLTRLGLPARSPNAAAVAGSSPAPFEPAVDDPGWLATLASGISEIVSEAMPRHVYLPLGVGGHADRRASHDAGLRALHDRTGRNVYLYEERPAALLPGAIRIRLAELGARLPPAATEIGDDPSLLRALLGFGRAPFLGAEGVPFAERARAARRLARALRASRAWRPRHAFGLRVQPVVEAAGSADAEGVLGALAGLEPRLVRLFGPRPRLLSDARRYAFTVSRQPYAERYWLLLPPRDAGGIVSLPMAETA